MDDPEEFLKLKRLMEKHDDFLRSLEPNRGLKFIHVHTGCVDLSAWLLRRLDSEVGVRGDFVYISDAHYKRSGMYVDYDSVMGFDYDSLIDSLLGERNAAQ
jgi:hypothetical protein